MSYLNTKYVIGYVNHVTLLGETTSSEFLHTLGFKNPDSHYRYKTPANAAGIDELDLLPGVKDYSFTYSKKETAIRALADYLKHTVEKPKNFQIFADFNKASHKDGRYELVTPDQLSVFKTNMIFEAVSIKAPKFDR